MRARLAGLALLVGLGAMLALNVVWIARERTTGRSAEAGRALEDVALPRLEGGQTRLSEARGHTLVLVFWATWCPPCVAEMPDVETAYRQLSPTGVRFLAVSLDRGALDEARQSVRAFVALHRLSLPVVLDDGLLADQNHVDSIPQTLILDDQGRIAQVLEGAHSADEMVEAVRRVGAH